MQLVLNKSGYHLQVEGDLNVSDMDTKSGFAASWGEFDMWSCRDLPEIILDPVEFCQIFRMVILAAAGP